MPGEDKYALITGAGLGNKGAQAMAFTSVSEVRRRFPELEPVVISDADAAPDIIQRINGKRLTNDSSAFTFHFEHHLPLSYLEKRLLRGDNIEKAVKRIIRDAVLWGDYRRIADYYRNAAICIDVSGFAFGDKWGFKNCVGFLDRLEVLRRLGVPTYLMPQSFGPFGFDECRQSELSKRATEVLPSVRIVFARERDGFEAMDDLCPGLNLLHSDDLVLQSRPLNLEVVFASAPQLCSHLPEAGPKYVGIVPNVKTYAHGDADSLDALYQLLVTHLMHRGYHVCLIRHSREDLEICKRVKDMFPGDNRVEMFGENRYCFEYEALFARFDFLIASRFHSIVHAYRQGVPCVALGWAVKYLELLGLVGQSALAFDVSRSDFSLADVLGAVDFVADERELLSSTIRAVVTHARENNAFDLVERDYRKLGN